MAEHIVPQILRKLHLQWAFVMQNTANVLHTVLQVQDWVRILTLYGAVSVSPPTLCACQYIVVCHWHVEADGHALDTARVVGSIDCELTLRNHLMTLVVQGINECLIQALGSFVKKAEHDVSHLIVKDGWANTLCQLHLLANGVTVH